MDASQEKILDEKVSELRAKLHSNDPAKQEFAEILNMYFINGRPKYFLKYKDELLSMFPKALETMPIDYMFETAHNLFLFVRTSDDVQGDRENQDYINSYVFQPFQKKLAEIVPFIRVEKLIFEPKHDTYVILTRHALTQGTYAPGKSTYSVCKALLKENNNVILCHTGKIDTNFMQLEDIGRFSSHQCSGDSINRFFDLRKIIQDAKPREILTEIELSELNLIEAIGVSSKVSLLSAGVFKTPWFDKKYLVTELYQDEDKKDKSLIPIPQVHHKALLAPTQPAKTLHKLKQKYDLEKKFVIGSFARYENFNPNFLGLAKKCLDTVPNSLLILAGPNDQSLAADFLSEEIRQGKVILFGVVNTGILGWMIDIFLEPFPVIAGFAALESIAKGKPVFTLKCAGLGNYIASRDKDLIFQNQAELVAAISAIAMSTEKYCALSKKSLKIAESFYEDSSLASSIMCS